TLDSAGLDAGRRAANLAGAMVVRDLRLHGGWAAVSPDGVVLVDDLVTTGATLAEAARALAVAGHPPRTAAVIAATERRSQGWDRGATVLASEP
ncbi:MAG: ComF family protein, partial [Actinomycetota bacterium]|nr:ComF family protein [Actinomycetota bacterium]